MFIVDIKLKKKQNLNNSSSFISPDNAKDIQKPRCRETLNNEREHARNISTAEQQADTKPKTYQLFNRNSAQNKQDDVAAEGVSVSYSKQPEHVQGSVDNVDIDVVIVTEYNAEQLEFITNNPGERQRISEHMGKYDVEILWPDKQRGEKEICLRSTSKDDSSGTRLTERRTRWRVNASAHFMHLLEMACGSVTSNVNMIIHRGPRNVQCKRWSPFKSKQIIGGQRACANNRVESPVQQPDACSSENLKKYAVCKVCSSGRCVWVIKGSLVELNVDVMVSTTDSHLRLATGLAKTISMKGNVL